MPCVGAVLHVLLGKSHDLGLRLAWCSGRLAGPLDCRSVCSAGSGSITDTANGIRKLQQLTRLQ